MEDNQPGLLEWWGEWRPQGRWIQQMRASSRILTNLCFVFSFLLWNTELWRRKNNIKSAGTEIAISRCKKDESSKAVVHLQTRSPVKYLLLIRLAVRYSCYTWSQHATKTQQAKSLLTKVLDRTFKRRWRDWHWKPLLKIVKRRPLKGQIQSQQSAS